MDKKINKISIHHGDAKDFYELWPSPVVIVSDGPYGINSYTGDLRSYKDLPSWYEPHIAEWTKKSTPETTLWFWNTEVGWATVHPILLKYGWIYRGCNVWDKGISHIAGNTNLKSLRKFPVVTEICAHYTLEPKFRSGDNVLSMQDWLRAEWKRSGLPFSKTNEASGLKNAATRKYFTPDHLWYYPPSEAFEKISEYANKFGSKSGKPYFSIDNKKPLTKKAWEKMRAKFYCPFGITNVWNEPPVNGSERLKNNYKSIHINQKPKRLMKLLINSSSEVEDVIWEPFGGLCTASIVASELGRVAYAAEINREYFEEAIKRTNSVYA